MKHLFCLALLAFPAFAADISAIRGEVVVRRSGAAAVPLKKGERVGGGDLVITGDDGFIRLTLRDQSVVTLSANSRYLLSVDSDPSEKQGSKAMVVSGTASLDLSKIKKLYVNKNESYKLYTPTSVCGVRGTKFTVQSDKNGRSRTAVTEGEIAVSGKVLSDDARVTGGTSVSKGQGFQSDKGGKIDGGKPSLETEKKIAAGLKGKAKPDGEYEAYYLELIGELGNRVLAMKGEFDNLSKQIKNLSDEGEAFIKAGKASEAGRPAEAARLRGLEQFVLRKEIIHRINQFRGYQTLLENSGKPLPIAQTIENLWNELAK